MYLDVKTIFEQAETTSFDPEPYRNVLCGDDLKRYLLFKSFLRDIILQIQTEVKTNTFKFFIENIKATFGSNTYSFTDELTNICEKIDRRTYEDIQIIKENSISASGSISNCTEKSKTRGGEVRISAQTPSIAINSELGDSIKSLESESIETKFSEILLQYYNPKEILNQIKTLLQKIGIKYVFICLDDFSEIEEGAMKIFVDTLVAPLETWSEEYFKFKIAGYPGRIYLGNIDPIKIETIKLDYYDLYLSDKAKDIEQEAVKNIERLLIQRCNYFCNKNPEYFFDTSKTEMTAFYKYLFDMTANVPRNIGWILWYANQYSISKNEPITINDLEISAERFYNDAIEVFFSQNKYMRVSFDEKFEKYHLKELLNQIVKKTKINKTEISVSSAKIFKNEKRKPLSSHFYINKNLEHLLITLELNFFITKYNEQKDKNANLNVFYHLNYGMCRKENINFGRGVDSKYVVQRRFDYSDIIDNYIQIAKEIKCKGCGARHPFEMLYAIKLFNMLCPTCRSSTCEVIHVEATLQSIDKTIELPEYDIKLLNALRIDEPQFASLLAQELDCSYQKVTGRVMHLVGKKMIQKSKEIKEERYGERNYYYLTEKAKMTYFT